MRQVVEEWTNGEGLQVIGGEEGEVGINEEGWLGLHTFFVQKGRLETTWKALRCFGYGEDLMLREEFLHPRSAPFLDLSFVSMSADGEVRELDSIYHLIAPLS